MLRSENKKYYDLTLMALDRKDITQTQEYHPKVLASSVLLKPKGRQTVAHHLNNKLAYIHLTEEDMAALRSDPEHGGFVKLDERGYIPPQYINPDYIALYYEYDTVEEMLQNNHLGEDDFGRLLMTRDGSGDYRLRHLPPLTWVIYRLTDVTNPRSIDSYQVIMKKIDMDMVVTWENIAQDFRSSVQEIDKMVRDAHEHVNKDVIEKLRSTDEDQLLYNGKRIIRRSEFQAVITKRNDDYANVFKDDMVVRITKDEDHTVYPDLATLPHPEPFIILEGNVDGYYKDNTEMETSPKIRTINCTSMKEMFSGCTNLKSLTPFSTKNSTDMSNFLDGCESLSYADGISFKSTETINYFASNSGLCSYGDITAPVALTAKEAFAYCSELTKVGVVKLPLATNASGMFKNDIKLERMRDTIMLPKVIVIDEMFSGCVELKEVASIQCPYMESARVLFNNCVNLVSIGYLDILSCNDATGMFSGCANLTYVYFPPHSLHTDISFSNTNLCMRSLKMIISAMQNGSYTIDISNTPANYEIKQEYVDEIINKGWTILR